VRSRKTEAPAFRSGPRLSEIFPRCSSPPPDTSLSSATSSSEDPGSARLDLIFDQVRALRPGTQEERLARYSAVRFPESRPPTRGSALAVSAGEARLPFEWARTLAPRAGPLAPPLREAHGEKTTNPSWPMEAPQSTSPLAAGLMARCPRCGEGALFRSGLSLRDSCERCELGYGFADSGDGPAVFATFILGFVILGGALLVEFRLHPPVWVHVVLWGLLTPLLAYLLLRVLKATLIALQYKHQAGEGRLDVD